jgi:TPR repeat protein
MLERAVSFIFRRRTPFQPFHPVPDASLPWALRDVVKVPPPVPTILAPDLIFGSRATPFLKMDRLAYFQRKGDTKRFQAEMHCRQGRKAFLGLSGKGFPDFSEAVKYYRLGAAAGNANAEFHLGVMAYLGRGMLRDVSFGVKCFRLAANKGHPLARFCYGTCLHHGEGVKQNLTAAVRQMRLAAESGYKEAVFHYGWYLLIGLGVKSDQEAAYRCFERAVNLGSK